MAQSELEICVRSDSKGGQVVEVVRALYATSACEPFHSPYTAEEIQELLLSLEWRLLAWYHEEGELASVDRDFIRAQKASSTLVNDSQELDEIGETLFRSLFQGKVLEAFNKSMGFLDGQKSPENSLRIWLRFDPDDPDVIPVSALPWEMLLKPGAGVPLGRSRRISLVRLIPVATDEASARPPSALVIDGPLRILGVSADPVDQLPLALSREWHAINSRLQKEGFQTHCMENPSIDELRQELKDGGWHVLHFMGHGSFFEKTGEGALVFTDKRGLSRRVKGRMLGANLEAAPDLRLVVLNSCRSGRLPRREGQSLFASLVPAILRDGVPAVIAMQFPISDSSAITFSHMFYRRLAAGDSVDEAIKEGRASISNDGSAEWVTPALFTSRPDGQVFSFWRQKDSRAANRPTPVSQQEPVRIGICSFPEGYNRAFGIDKDNPHFLNLSSYFEGPFIRDPSLWKSEILPRLRTFLKSFERERAALRLDLAIHSSLAFAAGYCLDIKSSLDITILQRTQTGCKDWTISTGSSEAETLWQDQPDIPGQPEAHDVALAIEVSRPVLVDVTHFLSAAEIPTSRILRATLKPHPHTLVVRDGTHALQIAQSLDYRIRLRTVHEREGTLHLFASAPNAVLFYLGQLSHGIGRVQLYEYVQDENKLGGYQPSFVMP